MKKSVFSVDGVDYPGIFVKSPIHRSFNVLDGENAGRTLDGRMQRNAQMRLLRDNIVIYDGAIASLQRFKDSVKEVASGYECGITFEKFQDIKEGDIIEAFLMEQIEV